MTKIIDISGQRFGRLVVIEDTGSRSHRKIVWHCLCDCGNETKVTTGDLKDGSSESCGCMQTKHRLTNHPLFVVWCGMKKRCSDPKHHQYCNYGGRGITVCDRWLDFQNFYDDMAEGYKKGLQIDRINTNGNYSPENCRWVTCKENNRNKRNNRLLDYKGETKTLTAWAETHGMHFSTLWNRVVRYGWTIENALETPTRRYR